MTITRANFVLNPVDDDDPPQATKIDGGWLLARNGCQKRFFLPLITFCQQLFIPNLILWKNSAWFFRHLSFNLNLAGDERDFVIYNLL